MSNERRNIAGFGNVAGKKQNANINVNDNANANVNDPMRPTSYSDRVVLKGIYMEHDLAKIVDKKGALMGRGGKSQLVNDALRAYFNKRLD